MPRNLDLSTSGSDFVQYKGPGPMAATITIKAHKHVILDIENYILSLKITQVRYIVQNIEYIIHLTNVDGSS